MLQASCGSDISHCSFAQNLIRTSLAVTYVRPLCRFSLLAKFTFLGLGFITSALKKINSPQIVLTVLGCNPMSHRVLLTQTQNLRKHISQGMQHIRLGISVSGLAFVCMQESCSDLVAGCDLTCGHVFLREHGGSVPLGAAVSTSSGNSYTVHIFTSSLYVQLK